MLMWRDRFGEGMRTYLVWQLSWRSFRRTLSSLMEHSGGLEVDEVPVNAPVWVVEELIAGFQVKTSGLHASFVGG
jgi:hypothetical protein